MSYLAIIGVGRGGIHTVNKMNRKPIVDEEKDIKCRLSGFRIVFFVAGMGGRTGRDLLPELVECCRELEITVSCFVTSPFTFEGDVKSKIAIESILNIRQYADSVVVINNDVIQESDSDFNLANAFHKSHQLLAENCEALYNILCKTQYFAVDLNDYYGFMRNSAVTIIATVYSKGEKRVLTAFEEAIKSPLFKPYKVCEMDRIIFAIQCSQEHQIQMEEVEYIHEIMRNRIKEDSVFMWSAIFNKELNEEIKVSIVASIKND